MTSLPAGGANVSGGDLDFAAADGVEACDPALAKDAGPQELLHAIRVVAAGDALLAPSITKRLIVEFAGRQDLRVPPAELIELTEREQEILRLVATGLNNAEIAVRLVIPGSSDQAAVRSADPLPALAGVEAAPE